MFQFQAICAHCVSISNIYIHCCINWTVEIFSCTPLFLLSYRCLNNFADHMCWSRNTIREQVIFFCSYNTSPACKTVSSFLLFSWMLPFPFMIENLQICALRKGWYFLVGVVFVVLQQEIWIIKCWNINLERYRAKGSSSATLIVSVALHESQPTPVRLQSLQRYVCSILITVTLQWLSENHKAQRCKIHWN